MNYSVSVEELRRLVDEGVRRELEALGARLAEFRCAGVDKLVLYAKMRLAIALLAGRNVADSLDGELVESLGLTRAAQTPPPPVAELFQIDEGVWRRLAKTRYTTSRSLLTESSSRRGILTYIWMRKTGILRRHPNGSLIVDRRELSRHPAGSERELGLGDIGRFLAEVPSSLWSKVITEELLGNAGLGDLITLAERYHGFDQRVDERLASEVRRRIAKGWVPSPEEARRLEGVIAKALKGLKTTVPPHLLPFIDSVEDYVKGREGELAGEIERLPLRERWEVLRSLRRRIRDPGFFKHLNPISLAELRSLGSVDRELASRVMLGQAIGSYLEYLLTRDPSFQAYAVHIAERIDAGALEPRHRPLLESILNGDEKKMLFLLGREAGFDALELLSVKLGEEYSRSGWLDPAVVKRAIAIGMRLLNYMRGGRGFTWRRRKTSVRGRLEVRGTLYKWVRLDNEAVFKRRERVQRVIGVVDVSGSMARFAVWSMLSIATVFPVVSHIVLFSEKPYVYRSPFKKTSLVLARFLEKLYTEGFKGYTNISEALRRAGELASRADSKTILVFSDLKQTVPDTEPWLVARWLVEKGLRVILVVPRGTESATVERYRGAGCDIVVVENPEDIPNILKRRINLKNRV